MLLRDSSQENRIIVQSNTSKGRKSSPTHLKLLSVAVRKEMLHHTALYKRFLKLFPDKGPTLVNRMNVFYHLILFTQSSIHFHGIICILYTYPMYGCIITNY